MIILQSLVLHLSFSTRTMWVTQSSVVFHEAGVIFIHLQLFFINQLCVADICHIIVICWFQCRHFAAKL